ncbi:MAG: hypothetical protein ABH803_04300 [Candidatus Micrarchaeota archaeon]
MRYLLFVLLLASTLTAVLEVSSPIKKTVSVQGEEVFLGVIGPGQTIELVADRSSGIKAVTSADGTGIAKWDHLVAVDLPSGWTSQPSKFYEQPMRLFITADAHAPDGDYFVSVRSLDEYEGAGTLLFKAKIKISRNVLDVSLFQNDLSTGAGQPAVFFVRLSNKGVASDAFEISLLDLPQAWVYSKKVLVPLESEVLVPYELIAEEDGEYDFDFNVESLSSREINVKKKAVLRVEASLEQDLRAISKGALLFPSGEQIVYALLGFFYSFD